MNQRTFLKTSAMGLGALNLLPSLQALPADHPYLQSIGVQLWTVRKQMEEDKTKTLRAVKRAGYRQVELMRTVGDDETVKIAKDLGLGISSAFIEWRSVVTPDAPDIPSVDQIIEEGKKIGLKFLVFGYIAKGHRETEDHFKRLAERANSMGEKCREAGMQLCYHNHSFEFAKLQHSEKCGFEVFIDHFDKDLVQFEVDVFWVDIGGWNAVETLKRLKGRVAQVHLKDKLKGTPINHDEGTIPNDAFKELGQGTIDMKAVIGESLAAGAVQCHVEQDQSPNPIRSIRQSIGYLREA